MLLHAEYAGARRRRQRLFPVKLRLRPAPTPFTRRFEAQLHWQPVVKGDGLLQCVIERVR